NEEDDELRQEDALHAPLREIDQRPRREKRQQARPQNRNVGIGRRSVRQNTNDLSAGALLCLADRGGNSGIILIRQPHHQLPDAPPPPDDPPPPPKPPPNPPPSPPPLHPEPQPGPPYGIKIGVPRLRPAPRPVGPPPAWWMRYQQMNITNKKNRIGNSLSKSDEASSRRTSTLACHSAVSPLSTLMIPSTPRSMPPEKSPALKRGMIALAMMTEDSASVSVPSRP